MGLVPLTRQKTSYLKPFKVHFFPHDPSARRLLEMMHFDFETQYTLKIPKPQDLVKLKKRDCAESFFLQKKCGLTILDNVGMITPGRSRLFPTVSDCFSFSGTPVGPVDHWFNKNHNIQHFSSRPFCAQVARNDAFWLWNPIYPKNPKTPRPREIQ